MAIDWTKAEMTESAKRSQNTINHLRVLRLPRKLLTRSLLERTWADLCEETPRGVEPLIANGAEHAPSNTCYMREGTGVSLRGMPVLFSQGW